MNNTTWIKERGTGIYKRDLTRNPIIAGYVAGKFNMLPDTRFPYPYYKSKDGQRAIRLNGPMAQYEILVTDKDLKKPTDELVIKYVDEMYNEGKINNN